MTFPVSPTNGQTTVVNNITYQYNSTNNAWRRVVNNVTTTTNIVGGATGSIPYQTAPGTTGFIGIGTSTYVLQSNSGVPTWVSTASLGISGGSGTVGSPFAGIFTITNTTQATSTITGALQVAGGAGIGGNLVIGSALNFTATNAFIQYGGNRLGYLQVAVQNANTGTTSTTDIVAFANNGNEDVGYIDFGITSSNYNDPVYTLSGPGDGFVYVVGTSTNVGKLIISTYQPQDIIFSTGGGATANEQGRFKHNQGFVVSQAAKATSSTGVLHVGPQALNVTDSNIIASFSHSVDSYAQIIVENPNTGVSASADFVVNNNSNDVNIYGDLGINSVNSNPVGDPFGDPSGTYVIASGGTLTIGTISAKDFKIATNNTTVVTISSSSNATFVGNVTAPNILDAGKVVALAMGMAMP